MLKYENPLISVEHVSFAYETEQGEEQQVIRDVSLSIAQGSFVSIIGHNGSGKSTLAKLLNALLLPSEGVVIVSGFTTNQEEHIWDVRCQIGMVFQNPDNQIVGTTVEDDVAFGMENLGVEPAEMRERINQALQAVKMTHAKQQQPHRLSGGQKQRVAIAGILAMRPSAIIFDEATAMLDPQGRKEVLQLAHRLHREEGITIINITHFPEETLLSDRVIVMEQGNIYADGRPAEVYACVERMQAIGVDVPYAMRLAHRLAKQGVEVAQVLTQEELVDELCRLLSTT